MFIYLVLYAIIFFLGIIYYYKTNHITIIKQSIALLVFLLLGFVAGSRFELGGYDYNQYKILFETLPTDVVAVMNGEAHPIVYRMEIGYLLYSTFIKSLINDFNSFLLITGLLSAIILYKVFSKYSKYLFLSLLLFLSKFYLYYFFTAQRQIIAMVICWTGLYFIEKRKLIPFIIIVMLASTFHSSAIIFIAAYFLYNLKFTNRQIYISMFIAALFGLGRVGSYFIGIAITNLPFLSDRMDSYIDIQSKATNILNYLELIPLFVLVVRNRVFFEARYKNFNLFFNLFFLSNMILIFFYEFNFIVRASSYFLLGYVFLTPMLLDLLKQKAKAFEIILFAAIYYLAIYIRYVLTFSGGEGYYPYKSFLF